MGGFIFFLFDNDKSGSLDFAEIKKIIEIIHSQDLNKTGSLQNKISRELENKPPHLNVDDFLKWTRAKPMLTNPVLVMQLKLQESAGGVSFWKMVTAQRNSNPVTAAPEYIYKEIARAEAIYSLFAKKKMATKKIDDMKGDVAKKSASSRPSDEKSLRRNSLMLGLMNLKEIKKPNRKNEKATFNVEKFRDENDMKFEGPKKGKKGDSGKTAVTISAIMSADDPIFVDSLNDNISNGNGNDTKTKPSSPSKKKGRSTIAVVNKDQGPPLNKSAKLDASEKFEKTESDKVEKRERQHRATVISPIGGRMPRNTIVGGSLPPIKAGLKKVD